MKYHKVICEGCGTIFTYSIGYWTDSHFIRCRFCGNDLKNDATDDVINNIEIE